MVGVWAEASGWLWNRKAKIIESFEVYFTLLSTRKKNNNLIEDELFQGTTGFMGQLKDTQIWDLISVNDF